MLEEKCQRESKNATMIQANWRSHRDHSKYLKKLMENQMYEEMCASKIQARWRGCLSRGENEKRRTAATVIQTAFRQISCRRHVNSIRDAVHNVHIFAFMFLHSAKVKAARRLQHWVRRHLCDILHAKTSTSSTVRDAFDSRRHIALNHLREKRIQLGLEKKKVHSPTEKESPPLLDRVTPELRKQIEDHITAQVQRQMAAFYKLSNRKMASNTTTSSPYQISPTMKPIVSLPSRKIHWEKNEESLKKH